MVPLRRLMVSTPDLSTVSWKKRIGMQLEQSPSRGPGEPTVGPVRASWVDRGAGSRSYGRVVTNEGCKARYGTRPEVYLFSVPGLTAGGTLKNKVIRSRDVRMLDVAAPDEDDRACDVTGAYDKENSVPVLQEVARLAPEPSAAPQLLPQTHLDHNRIPLDLDFTGQLAVLATTAPSNGRKATSHKFRHRPPSKSLQPII